MDRTRPGNFVLVPVPPHNGTAGCASGDHRLRVTPIRVLNSRERGPIPEPDG